MKYTQLFLTTITALSLIGCGVGRIARLPYQTTHGVELTPEDKVYTEEELKGWSNKNLRKTGFPGISLDDAYALLKKMPSQEVIVGVIDSGIDINHPDLAPIIWTNNSERTDGTDSDNNGYIDDLHGWNFLGDVVHANAEATRIVREGETHPLYQEALAYYLEEIEKASQNLDYYQNLSQMVALSDALLQVQTGKKVYDLNDIKNVIASSAELHMAVNLAKHFLQEGHTIAKIQEDIEEAIKHYKSQVEYHFNKDYNPRSEKEATNFSGIGIGNANVIGNDLDEALHGTHVAGIIGAVRGNGIGIDGVAHKVLIMPLRAVPNGDEYDKDVAQAIRYAVDNGAKVINTSFGKKFSPNVEWVRDAIKYAAENDVLIVNAAGNDTENIDEISTFPDDNLKGEEYTDNVLTIGALNYRYNENLPANFSNYGANNVDIFSPGVSIYATAPNGSYKFLEGTSMAAPKAAGLAALLRSYFPSLSAKEIKEVIMESGVSPSFDKIKTGDAMEPTELSFKEMSKTGKFINAYNAVIAACKKIKAKK